jgi:cytochrome c-type biogenesis protein CcmH
MPVSASSTASNEADRTPDSSAVRVEVRLDPKFKSKVSPNDTLFVFARSIDGPPMPLAVARLSASNLPASVTLTDAMAMTPQLKLSSSPHVQVSARISRSGDAIPHTGDLEARPVQAVTGVQKPVVLTIDRVH